MSRVLTTLLLFFWQLQVRLARTVFAFCPRASPPVCLRRKTQTCWSSERRKSYRRSLSRAQPHTEGIEQLKKLGITIVVDLRGENPELIEKERRQTESLGMRL